MAEDEISFTNDNISRLARRLGLGIFFLVFGLLKFTNAQWFIDGPYQGFYKIGFPTLLLFIIGIIQVAMALSFFFDKYAKTSAWIASVMFLSTIIATFPKIATTFQLPPETAPPGFLFFAVIPLLFMALSEALKVPKTPQKKLEEVVSVKEKPKKPSKEVEPALEEENEITEEQVI